MKERTQIHFSLPDASVAGQRLTIETEEPLRSVLPILVALKKGGARLSQVNLVTQRETREDVTSHLVARMSQSEVCDGRR